MGRTSVRSTRKPGKIISTLKELKRYVIPKREEPPEPEIVIKEVVKEVIKEVPVVKEIIKEVPVIKEVIREVIKEVPVEVIKEKFIRIEAEKAPPVSEYKTVSFWSSFILQLIALSMIVFADQIGDPVFIPIYAFAVSAISAISHQVTREQYENNSK